MFTDPGKMPSVVRFDLFELDIDNRQLRRNGLLVDLPPQPLKILTLLVCNPNHLVTRDEIKDALWPGETHGDFDSRLNFTIKKLRESLNDSAEQPRYVQTVRNAGYRFVAPIRMISMGEPDIQEYPTSVPVSGFAALANAAGHRGRWFTIKATLVATVVLIASCVLIGTFLLRQIQARNSAQLASRIEGAMPHDAPTNDIPQNKDGVPTISSVSPIVPQPRQRIVIRGNGFGLHVPFARTDSPYLAIGDETKGWAAGRLVPHNWDEVMLDVESWTDKEIVLAGFSGDYGKKGWELAEGDKVLVRVWNPQTGYGPAQVFAKVGSSK
jgi:DNA-binding winged helix-turn-helix (wHTH) protein